MFDLFNLSTELAYAIFVVVSAIVSAAKVIVQSGQTALLFTLGRVSKRSPLGPGFHLLIPFVHRARKVPTRSRTLDLPAQKIATGEGYVFVADANLVFRIVDVERALVMVDDLVPAMERVLTLGVQEVLRAATIPELKSGEGLDAALRANLEEKLEPWGVVVEHAGFPTITPSPRTLRITQLRQTALERGRQVSALGRSGEGVDGRALSIPSALGAVGTRRVFRTKARARRALATSRRAMLRLRGKLEQKGYSGAEIDRALAELGFGRYDRTGLATAARRRAVASRRSGGGARTAASSDEE